MSILGKLTLSDIPYDNPILVGVMILMAVGAVAVLAPMFYYKKWGWLWREWLTTVDHKKIGVMYVIAATVMLLRGFVDAIMMRSQQAMAVGAHHGYLPPEHYNQIFTAHGVIMIFFMAMPLMFGLFNLVTPLQIGARDVAFPFVNALSFWLFAAGAVLINISLVIGDFAATGWLAYPPLSELAYSPGVGVDYYIWALQISGLGSLLSGINFFVTIIKMRCPGMTMFKMPVFTWSVLTSSVLVIIAFPILTVTLGLLLLDRFFGMHFFTASFGGNAMMYINLIWAWGHPEVYILVLPAFGVFSEVFSTLSQKKLFGYNTMVWALIAITILSFVVWLHHFFTMGAGADVNGFFGIATMVIAIPTGVKVFNWLFTMYRGKVLFASPMLWSIGFLITFAIGGMTGVLMSVPAADFQLHNSLFLIAHFHNTIIGGVVFGYFAGITFWFPKTFGIKLNEKLGKAAFWCWLIGFYVAFTPLYILGFMGMTRRLNHYPAETGWHPFLIVAACGAGIVLIGIICQLLQVIISVKNRKLPAYQDRTGNPWNAATLEWSIPSPPPFYNFAIEPTVDSRDPLWAGRDIAPDQAEQTAQNEAGPAPHYEDIHMPRSSGLPIIISFFSFLVGFGAVWDIYWMMIVGLIGVIVTVLRRSFDYDIDYYVKAEEVAATEAKLAARFD